MLFAADNEHCLSEILIIAAALEIQDPRVRPAEKKKQADEQHEKFLHEKSDFLSMLNMWDFFHQLKEDLSKSKLKRACEQNFLSFPLMRQWQDIHRQLKRMVSEQGLKTRSRKNDYGAIHRSLLAGLLSGIALIGDRHEFTGAGGIKFHLWPGSGLFDVKPKWIVAAEVVETTRRYGRTVAKIAPEWIEPLAKHLTKSRYSEPHWSKKKQAVMASEHVALWGLPIVSGRSVNYGRIDPEAARSLFVQDGLTNDTLEGNFEFLKHNRWLVEQIQSEAAKTRRRDLIIDVHTIEAFYHDRLPEDAYDKVSLAQLIKTTPDLDSKLKMTRIDLLPTSESEDPSEMFPDQVQIGSMNIPIKYEFSPGTKNDGATIQLPVEGVGQLDDTQSGWLVPGLLEERVIGLIRSLPKQIRRNLVPAPDTARRVVAEMEFGRGNFLDAVASQLSRIGSLPIQTSEFKTEKLDDYLKVNLQVVDEVGEVIAEGRSVAEIRNQLGAEHSSSIVEVDDTAWNQDGLTDWSWGDFPKETMITRGGTQLAAYPTIVDQETSVGLRLADSRTASDEQTRRGLVRLFKIINRKSIKSQVNWLPELDRHSVTISRVMPTQQIKPQLGDLLTRISMVEREKIPRSEEDFRQLQSNAVERIGIATQELANWIPKFATSLHQAQLKLDEVPNRFSTAKGNLRQQLKNLCVENFLTNTTWLWLKHFPRYFEGMSYRIEKLASTDPVKDRASADLIDSFWQRYLEAEEFQLAQAIVDPELDSFRWLIEEFRISLFAQPLGTCVKVSEPRLEKQWAKVRRM